MLMQLFWLHVTCIERGAAGDEAACGCPAEQCDSVLLRGLTAPGKRGQHPHLRPHRHRATSHRSTAAVQAHHASGAWLAGGAVPPAAHVPCSHQHGCCHKAGSAPISLSDALPVANHMQMLWVVQQTMRKTPDLSMAHSFAWTMTAQQAWPIPAHNDSN